jgi:hypothetical protein
MSFVINLHLIQQISGNKIDVTGCWWNFWELNLFSLSKLYVWAEATNLLDIPHYCAVNWMMCLLIKVGDFALKL